jgi:hypothetical protein
VIASRAAGAKDDARDAHVLADALRTDRRAFRRVRPDDPLIIQLREATRLRISGPQLLAADAAGLLVLATRNQASRPAVTISTA